MSLDREAGARMDANTEQLWRDAFRALGIPDPAAVVPTIGELVRLARMQAEIGLDAIAVRNYGAALAYFRDAANFMNQAVRQIGHAAKRGETVP